MVFGRGWVVGWRAAQGEEGVGQQQQKAGREGGD
jgi:hypothetical protein